MEGEGARRYGVEVWREVKEFYWFSGNGFTEIWQLYPYFPRDATVIFLYFIST